MKKIIRHLSVTALAVAAMAAVPASALARHYDNDARGNVRVEVEVPGPREWRPEPRHYGYEERETRVWVEPVYRTVTERQWVEPVYQTVCDHVWVAPVVRTDCVRVWTPDRYEWRDVVQNEWGHRRVYREQVLVEPAHYEDQRREIVVAPGHYEDVTRQQLVCEGHWQVVEHQELVCAGHFQDGIERDYPRAERGGVHFEVRLPF